MVIFRFFKMAAAAILDFHNFKFLTVGRLNRVELHSHAKFGRNRLNRCRDIAILRFFQDGGRPPSWICGACVRTTHEGHLVVFITVQKFVGINSFDNMPVFRFREFCLKTPFHAPRIGFWGI